MNPEQWTAVDRYLGGLLSPDDAALTAAVKASEAAGLPAIQVTPNQGKLLHILARAIAARSVLEIGTLGGYSTIWLARALPADGHLVTIEADAKRAEVARANIAAAAPAVTVDLRVGKALDVLPQIAANSRGPFDLVFIDADKENTPDYFAWALKLTRRGGLIIVDNVVREGTVVDANSDDPQVKGMRRFCEMAAAEPGVSATAIQTVGAKGYDGFAIALVTADP
jgi:predicted O-methyltransferase YrrM